MDEKEAINKVVNISNNDILPNRFQPRKYFNEEEILQLSESIKEHGLINPIIVRKLGDKYELVAGERRYKANILAGNDSIPTIVMDINDKESSEIAVVENVQRKDLNAIEEAISYKRILDIGYMTQEQLAQKMGKSQSSIANKIRLLKLSDDVQDALMKREISERHARSLLKLNSQKKQNKMLERIIKERLTVRKLDEEIDKMNNNLETNFKNPVPDVVTPIQPSPITSDNNDMELESIDDVNMPDLNPIEETVTPINQTHEPVQPVVPEIPGLGNPVPAPEPVQPVVPEIPGLGNPVPAPEPVQPVVPEIPGLGNPVPTPEPVQPVAPEIPGLGTPVPAPEPVQPVAPEIPGLGNPVPAPEPVQPVVPEIPGLGNPVPTPEPVQPVVPEIPGLGNPVPAPEPVQPVAPEIPGLVNPVPAPEPVQPVVPEIPGLGNPVPTPEPVQPVAPEIPGLGTPVPAPEPEQTTTPSVPDFPWLKSGNPFANDDNESDNSPLTTSPIIDTTVNEQNDQDNTNNLGTNLNNVNQQQFETVKEPIITTDYNDQYDPIMPNVTPEPQIDFRTIINLIRECSNKIEKYGYKIETEEYNLDTLYQVVFKIEKK